jgi:hypothetical protein
MTLGKNTTERNRMEDWKRRHNYVVRSFKQGGGNITPHERAILALLDGIQTFSELSRDQADYLSAQNLDSIVDGFRGMLIHDIGTRLDAGTLDDKASSILESWGVDPDTGDYNPPTDEEE